MFKKIQKNWVTIVHKVQSIETLLDSASQKPDTRKVVMSLHDIRWIQEFFPLQERSLKRFNDSVDELFGIDISDKKTEIPIGVSCRTCDRLDCSQRAFPPLHKKFDVDINNRGVSVYVSD